MDDHNPAQPPGARPPDPLSDATSETAIPDHSPMAGSEPPSPGEAPAAGSEADAAESHPAMAQSDDTAESTEFDSARWARTTRGLTIWFAVLVTAGLGGVLLHLDELAALSSIAGLFVAAQAADLDRQWRMLYFMLSWVVPVAGVAAFISLAFMLESAQLQAPWGSLLTGLCVGGAIASALTLFRPFANALAAWMFRAEQPSRTLRLAGRMVFLTLLFAIPGWFAIRTLFDSLAAQIDSLLQGASLGTGLLGYIMLAFASVGFMLRRNARETLERLGIGRITASHALVIAFGVLGLFALNSGADWLQRTFFHALWLEDQSVSAAIGGRLTIAGAIMLGLSAGIGEEITMRGALQPKFGVVATSLLFASLHVQYSWFGITVIFLLGILLGLLRKRTNTSVAMAVHALYDMVAVLSIPRG